MSPLTSRWHVRSQGSKRVAEEALGAEGGELGKLAVEPRHFLEDALCEVGLEKREEHRAQTLQMKERVERAALRHALATLARHPALEKMAEEGSRHEFQRSAFAVLGFLDASLSWRVGSVLGIYGTCDCESQLAGHPARGSIPRIHDRMSSLLASVRGLH
eukprot:1783570-Amphidinium_carterae.1